MIMTMIASRTNPMPERPARLVKLMSVPLSRDMDAMRMSWAWPSARPANRWKAEPRPGPPHRPLAPPGSHHNAGESKASSSFVLRLQRMEFKHRSALGRICWVVEIDSIEMANNPRADSCLLHARTKDISKERHGFREPQ